METIEDILSVFERLANADWKTVNDGLVLYLYEQKVAVIEGCGDDFRVYYYNERLKKDTDEYCCFSSIEKAKISIIDRIFAVGGSGLNNA